MPHSLTLSGGPPWGMRLTDDTQGRPLVARVLSGGRAECGGVRIGDRIDEIDGEKMSSLKDAHEALQHTQGEMRMQVDRDAVSRQAVICSEKLSSSTANSPVASKKDLSSSVSVPSTPFLARAARFEPHNREKYSPRTIRADMFASAGKTNTQDKKRMFEQIAKELEEVPTDRLLRKKLQLGLFDSGSNSVSTTGYDSVFGDFGGAGSIGSVVSSRQSVESANASDDETQMAAAPAAQSSEPKKEAQDVKDPMLRTSSPGPSQWTVRTECPPSLQKPPLPQQADRMDRESSVEIPGRRSVAALRDELVNKLEVKAPGGQSSGRKTPSNNTFLGRVVEDNNNDALRSSAASPIPAWGNIKIHEAGFEDPATKNKPYLGRVIDGPIRSDQYFQGVPPLSTVAPKSDAPQPTHYQPAQATHAEPQYFQGVPPTSAVAPPLKPYQPPSSTADLPMGSVPAAYYQSTPVKQQPTQHAQQHFQGVPPTSAVAPQNMKAYQPPASVADLPLGSVPASYYQASSAQKTPPAETRPHFQGVPPTSSVAPQVSKAYQPPSAAVDLPLGSVPAAYYQDASSSISVAASTTPSVVSSVPTYHDEPLKPFYRPWEKSQPDYLVPESVDFNDSASQISSVSGYSSTVNGYYNEPKEPAHEPVHSRRHEPEMHRARMTPVIFEKPTLEERHDRETPTISCDVNGNMSTSLTSSRPEKLSLERSGSRQSLDLESSELLLKSRSPQPFGGNAYSSMSNDHFGTIRRKPSKVEPPVALTPTPAAGAVTYSFSNCTADSGFDSPRRTSDAMPAPFTYTPVKEVNAYGDFSGPPSLAPSALSSLDVSPTPPASDHSPYAGGADRSAPSSLSSQHPADDMSQWYKSMFKKLHKIDGNDSSVLKYRLHERSTSPAPSQRPYTPSSRFDSRPSSRLDDMEPRRAKSLGRADTNGWNDRAGRPAHFHLPSYKFRHEDPRAIASTSSACLRCGTTRRINDCEIEQLYDVLDDGPLQTEREKRRLTQIVSRRAISDRLQSTADELELAIQQLDECWRRVPREGRNLPTAYSKTPTPQQLASEIAELKALSKEEAECRQRADRLASELHDQRKRQHGYVPSAAPSLSSNMDRFEGLMNGYADKQPRESSTPQREHREITPQSIITATVVYSFQAHGEKELSLNRGDIVRVRKQIDANWWEGERNGKVGLFPASYVQVDQEFERGRLRMRAIYPFTARNSNEMSLNIGDTVTYRRDIDTHWIEGTNHIGEIGIFPKSYVQTLHNERQAMDASLSGQEHFQPIEQPVQQLHHHQQTDAEAHYEQQTPEAVVGQIPDRPKTPKVTAPAVPASVTFDIDIGEDQRRSTKAPEASDFNIDLSALLDETFNFNRQMNSATPSVPASQSLHNVPVQREPSTHPSSACNEQESMSRQARDGTPTMMRESRERSVSEWRQEQPPMDMERPATFIPKGSETFRVLFAYRPANDDELELQPNDIVFVVEKCDDGWFIGTSLRTGQFGTFPGNYVEKH